MLTLTFMLKFRHPRTLLLFLMLLFSGLAMAGPEETIFGEVKVTVNGKTLALEYANTYELRAQGLMFRESLCSDCGMLFSYNQSRVASMWMRNTLIPLDVAFIRKDGVITDIKAMQAHDETSITSSQEVSHAWEMNKGWFKRNDIKVGDIVTITERHF
jgi:uncharacterized protein